MSAGVHCLHCVTILVESLAASVSIACQLDIMDQWVPHDPGLALFAKLHLGFR